MMDFVSSQHLKSARNREGEGKDTPVARIGGHDVTMLKERGKRIIDSANAGQQVRTFQMKRKAIPVFSQ